MTMTPDPQPEPTMAQDTLGRPQTRSARRVRPRTQHGPTEGPGRGPARVFGYARVSTQGQEKQGYGLPSQQQTIREYCERQGWTLIRTFSDVISGAAANEDDLTLPRPGFEELLASVDGHPARYIVVVNTSRLWRSDLARILVTRALKKVGLDVRSIEQLKFSLYTSEPGDILIDGMMGLLDSYERLTIATRTRRGRLQKAALGGYSGGGAPYGYRAVRGSKVLQIDEGEARTVRLIFQLASRGMSALAIGARLNERNIPTRQAATWSHVQILRILRRRAFYQGKRYSYAGVDGPAQHPAILEPTS